MKRFPVAAVVAFLVLGSGVQPGIVAQRQSSASAVTIPFELATRLIIVKVTVNGSRPLSFVLDTGANAAIIRLDVAKTLGLTLEGQVNTGGAGAGTQVGSFVRNAKWSLVGLEKFSQNLLASQPRTIRAIDGVGAGGRAAGRLSGLALRVDAPDYRTIRVHEVLENSPATEAGIAEGDVLLTVDGAPAATLTLSAINEMFEQPIARALTLRRAGRVVTVTLTPKRLI